MAHLVCEVVYRGIFQKNLAARITRGIVLSARKAGKRGIAFGRYGDSPQRNGVPAKDFAIVADSQEELEQHMARYEPKELHVTICVDDTLAKGVESWAWYGLQPLNRLLLPDGHLLVIGSQRPEDLLRDLHQKETPYHLWLLRGTASFSGLWVYKEDHTEARVLGALARIVPEVLGLEAVSAAVREAEWGSDLKAESASRAYERVEPRRIAPGEGNPETPYSFELPRWWEMREGVSIPSLPVGKPVEGGRGYRPERSQVFKKFSTRTMRPVIDFEACVKCTLCWLQCPDSCFDVMPDGLYDANMEACCGCGVCEAVCPVKDCVTMVHEAVFEDNQSQWAMWRQDKDTYRVWLREKIGQEAPVARSHGFRYRGQYEEELAQGERELGGIPVTQGIPGENAAAKTGGGRLMAVLATPAAGLGEEQELLISGSEAVAEALTLADIDVVTAYPIRPYDTVMQAIAKKIANGKLVAEYIVAEGEHSQFEIVKHASTVGARVFCGSSGVGWMYAMEAITVTPALRVPMVALVGNRALDDPGAFGVEHNDALSVRDLGWLLCWIDTAQEAFDTTLIAYRVAEDRRIFLPIAISADGAFLTHSQALTRVPPRAWVDRFLPPYRRGDLLLHPDNPITVAPQVNEDWVIEIRRQNNAATERAYTVIEEAYADFRRVFGRGPENPWFEEYLTEDADVVLMGMGTLSLPVKVAIRKMRAEGKRVGLIRLRWFRPFPYEPLARALARAKAIGVIDRDYSFGAPFGSGVVATEVRATLYNATHRPPLIGFICGLGGREVTLEDVYRATDLCYAAAASGRAERATHWLGVRE